MIKLPAEVPNWKEVDGEVVPSYAPGHGNEPVYSNPSEAAQLKELQDIHEPPVVVSPNARALVTHEALGLPLPRTSAQKRKTGLDTEDHIEGRKNVLGE
jgi:hypothetical protein